MPIHDSIDAKLAERLKTVYTYHDRTKRDFHRSAASLRYLDWANQPDPFRRYIGARLFRLPLQANDDLPLYDEVYRKRTPAKPLSVASGVLTVVNARASSVPGKALNKTTE